jgi:MarR-like DNA-binding transcriptional regulator SgrR of sgrS sRNA
MRGAFSVPDAPDFPAHLLPQIFETLVRLDDRGRPQPFLATSWEAEVGYQRWRFRLRNGVNFHDGTPLDANAVAAALRGSNPEWKVFPVGDGIMIQADVPVPNLPQELALARNSIIKKTSDKLSGTGPFMNGQSISREHLTLRANDSYWGGRPFLDAIEVEFSNNSTEQKMQLDLAKADVVQINPEDIRRTKSEGRAVVTSEPEELLALAFTADARSDDETRARNALAASIDSFAINNVVFQGGGEPSGALLPNWISGYGFVFPATAGTHQQARSPQKSSTWTLTYDASDPIERVVAERILLNARDVEINLQLVTAGDTTLRLVRIPLPSLDPQVSLGEFSTALKLPHPKGKNSSATELYSAENMVLQSHRVIPLLYLRSAVVLRPEVRSWRTHQDGRWDLADVWISPEQP